MKDKFFRRSNFLTTRDQLAVETIDYTEESAAEADGALKDRIEYRLDPSGRRTYYL